MTLSLLVSDSRNKQQSLSSTSSCEPRQQFKLTFGQLHFDGVDSHELRRHHKRRQKRRYYEYSSSTWYTNNKLYRLIFILIAHRLTITNDVHAFLIRRSHDHTYLQPAGSRPKHDVTNFNHENRWKLSTNLDNALFRKNTKSAAEEKSTTSETTTSTTTSGGSTSFGNLLIKMKKKEDATVKAISGGIISKERAMKDQVLELDPIPGQQIHHSTTYYPKSPSSSSLTSRDAQTQQGSKNKNALSSQVVIRTMDLEAARDLDDSVSFLPAGFSKEDLTENMILLPLNPLYASTLFSSTSTMEQTSSTTQTRKNEITTTTSLRKKLFQSTASRIPNIRRLLLGKKKEVGENKETASITPTAATIATIQYFHRIGRDKRHLAVSIATSIDTVDQWRTFCKERGGIYPLLETIRDGARVITTTANNNKNYNYNNSYTSTTIRTGSDWTDGVWDMGNNIIVDDQEETFQVACLACRAIRDLCAISPELAAIITDSILRANAAWDGSLIQDFCTLLRYSSDYTAEPSTARRTFKSSAFLFRKKLRSKLPKRKKSKAPVEADNNANRFLLRRRYQRDTRFRCKLYVTQLLLAMTCASDDAVDAIRNTKGLTDVIVSCSSYALKEQTRRWLRYPGEIIKWLWKISKNKKNKPKKLIDSGNNTKLNNPAKKDLISKALTEPKQDQPNKQEGNIRRPFVEAGNVSNDLNGSAQRSANQLLAAIGYNKWIPKMPGQKGLRILSLDGGGSRGMAAISAVNHLMEATGHGSDVSDSFDMIVGTSTGGIISFLIGLRQESSARALRRYQQLISKIFIKSALSTPLMLFTTATYDESHFMSILTDILEEKSMLDSRADPAVPLVCCLTSKMSSTPTHVALFRNYNYANGELADPFNIDPDTAREDLNIPLEIEHKVIRKNRYNRKTVLQGTPGVRVSNDASRHPGSFRVLQRYALRASTAAPTVFKPVMMGGEMYCDGGIVTSNPTAVAIHEARSVFPDIPIELVVSVGTGMFLEEKQAPRIGWDGIIGQIVNSATDAEQIHHILEDIFGSTSLLPTSSAVSQLQYFRFNPVVGLPDEFPIDVTDPQKIEKLRKITIDYMKQPEQQEKIEVISAILNGRRPRRRS